MGLSRLLKGRIFYGMPTWKEIVLYELNGIILVGLS